MDPIHVGLGVAVLVLVFKDRIKTTVQKAIQKLGKSKTEDLANQVAELEYHSGSRHRETKAELNHIKGQLQEVLQTQKTPSARDPLIASIDGDVKALFQRLDALSKEVKDVKNNLPKIDSSPQEVYLQALASLAKGSDRVIEGQQRIEKLLVTLIEQLNKLTQ